MLADFLGKQVKGPERGVKAQRSISGYTVQSQYGIFRRREMIRIVDFLLEEG
jgi:hypothetical protein